jgi:ribulose-5-phosphate 4-epimerase/fuculose-1-phosphate aldolase/pimeloyl-ACP methyl ester carboxylesterase
MSTYVLVHGAWGGAHGWRKVRPLLQQAGQTVYSPSLTGQGERAHLATPEVNLSTHIEDVCNAIWYEDLSEVILIGHSYGGMVVTGVADRMPERIKHLVYLDAFLPGDSQSLYDLGGGVGRQSSDWRVPRMPRNDPPNEWEDARRVLHPKATLEEKVKLSAPLESRPFSLTYIVATGRSEPGGQFDRTAARLRDNPRWNVREISGGHGMIRTNPDGLVRLLLELFPPAVPPSVPPAFASAPPNGTLASPLAYASERREILAAADLLVRSGVLSHSNHGNASVRLPDGNSMLITGVSSLFGQTPETLARLDLDGNVLEGKLASTSAEIVSMHAVVYRQRPEVGAVIHTHSPMVSTYAMAHTPMPIHYEGLLRQGVSAPIPVAAWGPRGSRESVTNIEDALRADANAPAVLLANHGLLAWSRDSMATARLIIALEEAAEMMLRAEHLGGSRALPPGALEQVREHMRAFATG